MNLSGAIREQIIPQECPWVRLLPFLLHRSDFIEGCKYLSLDVSRDITPSPGFLHLFVGQLIRARSDEIPVFQAHLAHHLIEWLNAKFAFYRRIHFPSSLRIIVENHRFDRNLDENKLLWENCRKILGFSVLLAYLPLEFSHLLAKHSHSP